MSGKDVATFAGGLPANPEDLEAGLQGMQSQLRTSTGGLAFLRLMKSGVFVYGAENIEIEEGSSWAINPYSLMHGFACWGTGELLDERMVPFTQAPPVRGELPDLGYKWEQQVSMHLMCLDGEDEGTTVLYKGTSTGLRNATKELINDIIAQLQKDKVNLVPVVQLESDWYKHKEYGQIFFPIINIVDWIPMEGKIVEDDDAEPEPEADDDAEGEAEPPETPTTTRRRRGAKAAEAKPEAPQSSNRRRRRRKAKG